MPVPKDPEKYQQWIENLRKARQGRPSNTAGKKRSPEQIERIRQARLGKPSSKRGKTFEEILGNERASSAKQKLRSANLGKTAPNKGKTNIEYYGIEKATQMQVNRDINQPSRKGMSDAEYYGQDRAREISKKIGVGVSRTKREYWKDKKKPDDRQDYRYLEWRTAVLKRDNNTCQKCGKNSDKRQRSAHHIKDWDNNPELRYDVNNGITYCTSCHVKTHLELRRQAVITLVGLIKQQPSFLSPITEEDNLLVDTVMFLEKYRSKTGFFI